jgi:hypothetical protein
MDETNICRDFSLTIERCGDRVRAIIELTPAPGDRRLGRVVDVLYQQARLLSKEPDGRQFAEATA